MAQAQQFTAEPDKKNDGASCSRDDQECLSCGS